MPEKPRYVEELSPQDQVRAWLGLTVQFIEHYLDVRDLTTSEILQIRKYVEEARGLRLYLKDKFLTTDRKTSNYMAYKLNTVVVVDEVLSRYLGFYGIDVHQISNKKSVHELVSMYTDSREYIKRKLKLAREEMHKP